MPLKWRSNSFSVFLGVAAAVLLASCAIKSLSPEPGNPKWGLDVTWHGHSCFTLKDSVDRTLVIDPFDETVGYGRLHLYADALFISHHHFDHDFQHAVKPERNTLEIIDSSGTATVAEGLQVTGLPSAHDNQNGEINGPNTIFIFVMGGLRCVFMGDIGTPRLNDFQKKMIGKVDVLFIPVGGKVTIDAAQAKKLVDELKPAFVFPMHYGNVRFYPLDPVDKFTVLFPADQTVRVSGSSVRLHEADLTDKPVVYILTPTPKN